MDDLIGLPLPAFYALPVPSINAVDIDLPFGKVRPDGMAVEFTVQPSRDVAELVSRIGANIEATRRIVYDHSGATLTVEPRFFTHQLWIDSLPEDYGNSCSLQILGCAPDFCAYHTDLPERPDPKMYNWRTTGGHIHFEVGSDIASDRAAYSYITAALDQVIGTAATYLCDNESAFRRKELYGQAGMIRCDSDAGILEYRTLPAQALIQRSDLATLMFTAGQQIVGHLMDIYHSRSQPQAIEYFRSTVGAYGHLLEIAQSINTHNVSECRDLQRVFMASFSQIPDLVRAVEALQAYKMPDNFLLGW